MKTIFSTLLLASILFPFESIFAFDLTQNIKYSINYTSDTAATLNDSTTENALNYRVNFSENFDNISLEGHYQLNSTYNNNNHNNSTTYIDPDSHRLFDLSSLISDSNNKITSHRLDRFYLSYNTNNTSTKFGRHAVTWGNGLVYNVIDIFNPFSPTANDKEYKVGDDMLHIQALDDNGNDWQLLYLPRRDNTSNISHSVSSTALKYHSIFSNSDIDILIARHYEDNIIGAGFNHALGESIWRLDITHTQTKDKQNVSSLVTNIDYSWITFNKNIYGFIEFYHNGFGNTESINPNNVNLNERIERGELFSYFRNYLTTGISIELHPLLTLSTSIISNIDNNASSIIVNLNYDLTQYLSFKSTLLYNNNNRQTENDSIEFLLSYYF